MKSVRHPILEYTAVTMPAERSMNWKSELVEAIIDGDMMLVRSLLSSGADINQMSLFYGHKEPPLLTAIRYVRLDIAKALLIHGADVNLPSSRGLVPLVHAAERNFFTLMNDLIRFGADINALDGAGHSALYWMVKARNMDVIQELIKNGANINLKSTSTPRQPLLHLVVDSTELTRYMLDEGAKVNALDEMHETPLFPAVRADNVSSVQLLLSRGVRVNEVNDDYRTALHLAAASVNNSLEITELLLQHGAEVNAFDRYLNTPLVLTLRNYILQPNKKVARCLIQHGSLIKYKLCSEALEWTIGTDLELLQFAISAGLRLCRVPWVRELLCETVSRKQWHIIGQDNEHKQRVIDYVRTELQHVHSLSTSCRIVIREHLIHANNGHSILAGIRCLPLPQTLKEYLQLTDG